MTTHQSAIEVLKNKSKHRKTEILPLANCLHLVSADEVFAPINVPSFDNAAMDGYVFRFEDFLNELNLQIINEIQAGTDALLPLKKGEAARIFTGAPIPENGDTVIPQEDVLVENGMLKFQKKVNKNANVRQKGTQTQKGTLILKKNTKITAEYIGFLATFGIAELEVFAPPKIGIITTGKELVKAGNSLENYQIYDSNSVFLTAAFEEIGLKLSFSIWVDDNKNELKNAIQENVEKVDVLIFTGGISVGDYDFLKPVLDDLDVQESFYRVKQKPGKPLFFGTLNNTEIFALPGNPSAVVMCFHVYLKPFIKEKMGIESFTKKEFGILMNEYIKKSGLTHFVKAFVENNKVEILNNQLSYQMDAYTKANAFAILTENQEYFQIGDKVEVIKFRN
jgi:molybdopterin molybdotransferase